MRFKLRHTGMLTISLEYKQVATEIAPIDYAALLMVPTAIVIAM
jgi:hypothetical protein